MATFHIHIATVDEILFQGEAEAVSVPGSDGVMTILPHHEPVISTLQRGAIRIRGAKEGESEQSFPVEQGVLEVSHNKATILL